MTVMLIEDETVVTVRYRMATLEEPYYDEAWDDDSLVYVQGHHAIVPGLESALAGHAPGESMMLVIPPRVAHGERDRRLDRMMPIEDFPPEVRSQVEVGFEFSAEHPFSPGQRCDFVVTAIEGRMVGISGNHVLAGRTLLIEVEVLNVRNANMHERACGEPETGSSASRGNE
jgi:FKBP-type peptidyl-prolyl cis-trans isomerase SlyD